MIKYIHSQQEPIEEPIVSLKELYKVYFNDETLYYTPCSGILNSNIIVYNELVHIHARLFFSILDSFNLDYYVFAGTSIGYVRTKSNIPWADDYDIIVFEKDINYLEKEIWPVLTEYKFDCRFGPPNAGLQILSHPIKTFHGCKENYFQCDIFYTKIDENNLIKNTAIPCWGLYSRKEVSYDMVSPARRLMIDGIELPFFNQLEADVFQEYDDVFNSCCIHINHNKGEMIMQHFSIVYTEFNEIVEKAKNNTIDYVFKGSEHKYENSCSLKSEQEFSSVLDVLVWVKEHNVKKLFVLDNKFLKYLLSIKHYFPEIVIVVYLFEEINDFPLMLNYADVVKCKSESLIKKYDEEILFCGKRPIFDLIKVITFGTYDLFHEGHFNILKRSKELGFELIVGVSSNALNLKKGKTVVNDLPQRISDVNATGLVDECFVEESLEEKDAYIQSYNADILVMGDDWKGSFDWVSCPVVYLPRTPNISTTMLKEKLNEQI